MDRLRSSLARDLTCRRGLTVIEVLVAGVIFLGLAGLTLMFYQTSITSQRKSEVHSEAYRSALVGVEQVRRELRGARILNLTYEPDSTAIAEASELEYQQPRTLDGHVVMAGQGRIDWLSERRLYLDGEERLWAQQGFEEPRLLTRLGSEGSVTFRRLDEQLLQVELVADYKEAGARKVVKETIFLANQYR